MEEFVETLEKVGNTPFDIRLYPKYIRLAAAQDHDASGEATDVSNVENEENEVSSLGPLAAQARRTMTTAMAATEDVWLPLLKQQYATLDVMNNAEDAQALEELFRLSREDYLSIPILKFQAQTLIDLNARQGASMDTASTNTWSDENIRSSLEEIYSLAAPHISRSHEIWKPWIQWELERLEAQTASIGKKAAKLAQQQEAVSRVDGMFIARLQQLHSDYTTTSEMYSPFVSSYFPDDQYEAKLIASTKARELPLKQLSWREGNPKRVREQLELRAKNGGLVEWRQYLSWELKAKKPQRKLIMAVYERAVEVTARARWNMLCQVFEAPDSTEATQAASESTEANLKAIWEEYLVYASLDIQGNRSDILKLMKRATRCIPASGEAWAIYMRNVERATQPVEDMEEFEWEETVEGIYSRAVQMGLLQSSLEDFVPVVLTRAAWSRRRCFVQEEGETVVDQDCMAEVIQAVEEGISIVRKLEGGDPKMRLEGFLSTFYLSLPLAESAVEVLQSATKFYKTSYLAWLNYIDLLISERQIVEARRVFKDASQRKGLDWPEAVWERWVIFEHQFGTVEEVTKTISVVRDFKKAEEFRRKKAWEAHAQTQAHVVAPNGLNSHGAAQATEESSVHAIVPNIPDATMDTSSQERHLKRKRSVEEEMDSSPLAKKSKHKSDVVVDEPMLPPAPPTAVVKDDSQAAKVMKRDREHTTIMVSNLPHSASEEDLAKLFKDCGEVREILIKKLPNEVVATVEFMSQDSIPAALTRDLKRIHNVEINVSVAGQSSTLWVTNFREDMDDAEMRALFEKFGAILDIRWPSKHIKDKRRFCYVVFTNPKAAQDALNLNGFELDPGLSLKVLISDPARRERRTDAGARELRVTGVVKSVTKEDLEKLFSPHGALKGIRLVPATGNNQTAFVEYETEDSALRGLGVNNHVLKGRHLGVTMADTKPGRAGRQVGAREELNSRSIRVKNVPSGTQQTVLQQALEKNFPVVRLQLFADKNEATVEVTNAADAGRILLEHPTISFQEATLTLVEEGRSGSVASRGRGRGGPPSRGGSGRRAGLGMRGGDKGGASANPVPADASGGAAKSQADFRKMLGF